MHAVAGAEGNEWQRWVTAVRLAEQDDPASEEVLWELLDDPDEQVRKSAASSLIYRNPKLDSAELLRRLRRSSDHSPPTVAEILAYGLSRLESVDVVSPLIEALDAASRSYRPDLLLALAMTQQSAALQALQARLNAGDVDTRRYTAWVFGFLWPLGDDALQPLLAVLRTNSDSKQRENACSSLGNWISTSEEAAETVLKAALADPSRRVRREAQDTLVQRRAVTRLRVEMALQKEGRLRRRLRAGLILRRMTLHDTQGWKRTVFKTALVLRSLPF